MPLALFCLTASPTIATNSASAFHRVLYQYTWQSLNWDDAGFDCMIELYYAVRHQLSSLLILLGALVFVFGLSVCCQKSERRMTASVLTLYVFGGCCYLCYRWVLSRVVLVNCCYSVLSLSVCQSVSLPLSSFNCFGLNKQKVFFFF